MASLGTVQLNEVFAVLSEDGTAIDRSRQTLTPLSQELSDWLCLPPEQSKHRAPTPANTLRLGRDIARLHTAAPLLQSLRHHGIVFSNLGFDFVREGGSVSPGIGEIGCTEGEIAGQQVSFAVTEALGFD